MKIQYLAIIFLIIIIPMTLVLTIYNQSQINNLNLQLLYNTYLSDATHNAIKAFELNTVNNKYSQVADSLKRDVEASVNVFLNSMAKSLGTSGATADSVSEYVPAVLFTLYDGYYVYAPAYSEELIETTKQKENLDGTMGDVVVPESQDPPVENFSHMLKPYVYYSIRYNPSSETDFIVNYTLDNYITIYGKVNGKYVTKSGYLLQVNSENTNLIDISVDINQDKLLTLLKKKILSYKLAPRELDSKSLAEIKQIYADQDKNELKRYINFSEEGVYRTSLISDMGETLLDNILDGKYDNGQKIELKDVPIAKIDEKFINDVDKIKVSENDIIDEVLDCFTVKYREMEITDTDAKSYYVKGLQFSMWVNNNLSTIKISDAKSEKAGSDSNLAEIEIFKGNNKQIFNTKKEKNNNPEELSSAFTQHKNEVIKQSIQSNLTSSIARYNQKFFGLKHGYDLKMPILNEDEWKSITNKVTMVTFMQGMVIGNKVFNDYFVVSSDKNKELVEENEIYYFNKNASEKASYHRLDCPNLLQEAESTGSKIIGFKAIEFDIYKTKDEEGNLQYGYGEEIEELRDNEYCVMEKDSNGNWVRKVITNAEGKKEFVFKEGAIRELSACYNCLVDGNYLPQTVTNENLRLAQRVAVAREKNRHYKVNAYLDSYDIQYKKKNIVLEASTTDYTNQNVIVSLTSDLDKVKYYFEGQENNIKDWPIKEGVYGTISVTNNTTVYAYSTDDPSRVASIEIKNIDKTAPEGITMSVSNVTTGSFDLTVTANDRLSGIEKYEVTVEKVGDENYKLVPQSAPGPQMSQKFNFYGLSYNTQYKYSVKVYDKAGNVREIKDDKYVVTTRDR